MKKLQFFRIAGLIAAFLPTLLLLWVVVDLLFFSLEPYPYGDGGDLYYMFLKESIFWKQYIAHCHFFNPKWITSVVWHFTWFISLISIMILSKYEQESMENNKISPISLGSVTTTKKGYLYLFSLLNYVNNVQLVLLIIGTFVVKIKKWSHLFYDNQGGLIFGSILFYLIILGPFSILPQFFLLKIYSRRSFQKLKFKRDYATIPLMMIILVISFLIFGRTICMG